MKINKLLRGIVKIFVLLFIYVSIFEIGLQIVSLTYNKMLNRRVTIWQERNTEKIKKQEVNILCVGDSFTQGVGANQGYAYPMQLQRYLREKSFFNWQVYNAGVAGITSSDLAISILPRLLEETRPTYIIVLAGANDYLINDLNFEPLPELNLPLINNNTRVFFPWRLYPRTPKLIKMISKYFWDIKITKNNFNITQKYGLVTLNSSIVAGANVEDSFNKKKTSELNYLDTYIQQALDLILLKRIEKASSLAHFVESKIQDTPSPLHIRLARVFINTREFSCAYRAIAQYRRYRPDDPAIWEALGDISFMRGHYEIAESYLRKAIKIYPHSFHSYRLLSLVYIFQNLHNKRLEDSLRSWMQAYLLDKNMPTSALFLSMISDICNLSFDKFKYIVDKFRDELSVSEDEYIQLYKIGNSVYAIKDTKGLLKKNLYRVSSLCLKYNVKPIFMTYPMSIEINQIIKEYCYENGEYLLDIESIFKKLIKTRNFKDYFAADGHLNNEGYRTLSEELGNVFLSNALVRVNDSN